MPQRVRIFGLEADGRWLACHPLVVVAEATQVAVDGRGGQLAWRELLETIRCINTMLNQQLQDTDRREMPALLVGGPDLHGSDDLAPTLNLGRRHHAWMAAIGTVCVFWPAVAAQQAIQRGSTDGVELRRGRHQSTALGMACRQCRNTTP